MFVMALTLSSVINDGNFVFWNMKPKILLVLKYVSIIMSFKIKLGRRKFDGG